MAQRLTDLIVKEASLVDFPANEHARVMLFKRDPEAVEKGLPTDPKDYAYAPDKKTPSTWKLPIHDAAHVGAAAAALGKGFRGSKVAIPEADRDAVKAKVRAAWKRFNPDKKPDDMPAVLKSDMTAADVHVPGPIGAMKLVPYGGGKYSVHDKKSGKRVSGPHKNKAEAEASMANKRLDALVGKVVELAKHVGEATPADNEEAKITTEENADGSAKVDPLDGGKATTEDGERGSGDPIQAGDEGSSSGMEEYDEVNDIGILAEGGKWYLANGESDKVGGPFADKEAARAALQSKVGKAHLAELKASHKSLGEEIEKAGAKISARRLKQLKDVHQAVGDVINEQDPTYMGGPQMTDAEKMAKAVEKAANAIENLSFTESEAVLKALLPEEVLKAMPPALQAALDKKKGKKGDAASASADAEDAKDGGADDAEENADGMKKRLAAIEKKDPALGKVLRGIQKSADERVRKAEERITKAEERAEASETIAKEERDRRVTMELTAVAKNDLAGLPGTVDEKVTKLRTLYTNLPKADADAFVTDMKKSAETIRTSAIFKESGAIGDGGGATAASRIEEMAKARLAEVNKSATGKDVITYAKAYDETLKANPELYKQYLEERNAAH